MKRILLFVMSLSLVLLFSGCGISQSEYDALLAENKTLQQETESLSIQIEALSSENDSLSTQITELFSENNSLSTQIEALSEYKANQILNSMDKSYGKAWASTAFGDNLYFQCISDNTYSISYEGLTKLWSDLKESVALLGTMLTTYSDKVTYETISIKFFDPTGTYILDVILKRTDNSYSLDSMACNILYADIISSAFVLISK